MNTLLFLLILAAPGPMPDQAAIEKARAAFRELYAEDFAKAKKPAEQVALAKQWMATVDKVADDRAAQYVLLSAARRLATAARDRKTATEAVTAMLDRFEADKTLGVEERIQHGDECLEAAKKELVAKKFELQIEAVEYYLVAKQHANGLQKELASRRLSSTMAKLGGNDIRTETSISGNGGPGQKFVDQSSGGVLVGLEIGVGKWGDADVIKSLRPIYRVGTRTAFGRRYGTAVDRLVVVKARNGYAVSGMTTKSAAVVDGLSLTFSQVGREHGSYESEWIGGKGGGPKVSLGGDGVAVGVVGFDNGNDCIGVGLIMKPASE
jgi:hypothetical protein